MNLIKNTLDINDLANLSGVKAHTIRAWEKRYELLNPLRSKTNIREYSIADLRKILNVVMLYEQGWKISKIAKLKAEEVKKEIDSLIGTSGDFKALIVELKLNMLGYDEKQFCD